MPDHLQSWGPRQYRDRCCAGLMHTRSGACIRNVLICKLLLCLIGFLHAATVVATIYAAAPLNIMAEACLTLTLLLSDQDLLHALGVRSTAESMPTGCY